MGRRLPKRKDSRLRQCQTYLCNTRRLYRFDKGQNRRLWLRKRRRNRRHRIPYQTNQTLGQCRTRQIRTQTPRTRQYRGNGHTQSQNADNDDGHVLRSKTHTSTPLGYVQCHRHGSRLRKSDFSGRRNTRAAQLQKSHIVHRYAQRRHRSRQAKIL